MILVQTPAQVVKLVYTPDLGSGVARREGSSPFLGTLFLEGLMFKKLALATLASTSILLAKPDTVVFDFGGVMCTTPNTQPIITFLCESLNMTQEEFTKANNLRRFEIHNGTTDVEFWSDQALQRNIDLPADWEEKLLAVLKDAIQLNHDMYDLVEELKEQNIRVAILSNITPNKAHLLRKFGYYKPFEAVVLSCDVNMVKPDPRIYQVMLDTLQTTADRVIFVDDKLANVQAAQDLGIDAHHFTSSDALRTYLKESL